MAKLSGVAVFLMLGSGCAQTDPPATVAEPGNQALGIAEFDITETPSEVAIVAFDAAKQEVGRIEAVAGKFVRSAPFGMPGEVAGHRLTIDFKGVKQQHQSEGEYEQGVLLPVTLPRIFGSAPYTFLDVFVRDPHVRPVLAKYGILFEGDALLSEDGQEVAYFGSHDYSTCNGTGSNDGTTDPNADTCNRTAAIRLGRTPATILGVAHFRDTSICNGTGCRDTVVFACQGGQIATSHGFSKWGEAKYCCANRTNNCLIAGTSLHGGQNGCAIIWGPEETNAGAGVNYYAPTNYPTCTNASACTGHCAIKETVWVDPCSLNQCIGLNCGTKTDACYVTQNCGSCTLPQTCGGGGTPNVCGCIPTGCGGHCGSMGDGCGGSIWCGGCGPGQNCEGNDCKGPTCGDNYCAGGVEDCGNCPGDCPCPSYAPTCLNGTCVSCTYDCAGVCNGGATYDCAGNCGGGATDQGCGCGAPGPNECGCSGCSDQGCGCCNGPDPGCGCGYPGPNECGCSGCIDEGCGCCGGTDQGCGCGVACP